MGKINFYGWCRGYAGSGSFDNLASRRFRDFPISGGGVQTDSLEFLVSANVLQWESGQRGYPKSDSYEKFNPRLMIGIYDSTAPNDLDYNPMVGFEFNLDFYSKRKFYTTEDLATSPLTPGLNSPGKREGQTFSVSFPYNLKSIWFCLRKIGDSPSDDGKVICEICKTYNEVPSGSILASGSIHFSSLTSFTDTWKEFELNTTVKVSANTLIAAYIRSDDVDDTDTQICILGSGPTPSYPSGKSIYSDNSGSSWNTRGDWDYGFKLYGSPSFAVRPFICKDITTSDTSYPEYVHGDWCPTGSYSYKVKLSKNNLEFYVDNNLHETWNISDITLDGGYKFGKGYVYNWDRFRIQLIDTATETLSLTKYVFPTGTIFSANTAGENIEQSPATGEHSDKLDEHPTHDGYSTTIYLPSGSEYKPDGEGYQEIYDRLASGSIAEYTDDTAAVIDYIIYMTARHSGNGELSYGQPVVYADGVIGYSPAGWQSFYPDNWSTGSGSVKYNPSTNKVWKISELKRSKMGYLCTNAPNNKGSHYLTQLYGEVFIAPLIDGSKISGNIAYYSVKEIKNPFATSYDSGSTWTVHTDKSLNYAVGWNYDYITGRITASDENLNKYGRHLYTINEPLITTVADAESLAQQYVNTYMSGIKVGSITINGRTDIDLETKFRLSGAYLDFNEVLEIASYTQRLDKNGLTTTIYYGTEPFDIAKKVANLESEVYG